MIKASMMHLCPYLIAFLFLLWSIKSFCVFMEVFLLISNQYNRFYIDLKHKKH